MNSLYAFSDPVTRLPRLFYGHLYDCQVKTPLGCPYAMIIDNCFFCNHPHGRDNRCNRSVT